MACHILESCKTWIYIQTLGYSLDDITTLIFPCANEKSQAIYEFTESTVNNTWKIRQLR